MRSILESYSISAGLDYPGVGPQHARLEQLGRVNYTSVNDAETLAAFQLLSRTEGIIPALESAHAIYHAVELAGQMKPDEVVVVNLSGRGDKDVNEVMRLLDKAEGQEAQA